jgi:ketosteroid isomerase-like protein
MPRNRLFALSRCNGWNYRKIMMQLDALHYSLMMEAIGPAAIQETFIKSREKYPELVVNWTTDNVEIAASGDLAVEYGSYTMTNQGQEDHGKYVTVYRKVNGTWKVAADIGTSTKPKDILP